ncbi:MAG TPA: hypothetical protein VNL18_11610 [Gemmatimonadales bacterium]|nr:hypothetical protein [Gemmatimonadales bacterium]
MRKLAILGAAGLLVFAVFQLRGNRQAIARAKAEAAALVSQRDSLVAVVERREREQAALTLRIETQEAAAVRLRDSVDALERRRAATQLTVRRIRATGALIERLRSTFPELADSAWGLTTVPLDARDTIGIEYLMVPAWFAETFVIDHANAESWRAQKDQLLAVDSLRLVVASLQDSVLALETANTRAYEAGYQAAYAAYQDISGRYVAELKKPRITLGRSFGLIAAAGAGFLLARTAYE